MNHKIRKVWSKQYEPLRKQKPSQFCRTINHQCFREIAKADEVLVFDKPVLGTYFLEDGFFELRETGVRIFSIIWFVDK